MNKQMKKARQMMDEMFPNVEARKEPEFKAPVWYYITRNRDTEMLQGFSGDGKAIWCEHDLQYLIPHVYTNSRHANRDKRLVGGDAVKSCRYLVINGKRIFEQT